MMLCATCRRQTARGAARCTVCGASPNGSPSAFDLILRDGSRVPVDADLTLGRAPGNTVQLTDPSVSRRHARISVPHRNVSAPVLEDSGSAYGTWLDGSKLRGARPVHDGSRIRIGNEELIVERRRSDTEPGRTFVVPPGASAVARAARAGAPPETATTRFGLRPRLRSGYALKRLAASEGPHRWVLKRLESGHFVQLSDANAQLLSLLDGKRTLRDLVGEAERRLGSAGRASLVGLLSELSDGGFLAGAGEPAAAEGGGVGGRRVGLVREKSWPGAAAVFERIYDRGGWLLFTRPALVAACAVAALGLVAFALLVVYRYGTPFVVAKKVGLGGLVFVLGRAAVVAVHETAHGLTMTSFGRRPGRAGLKLVLIFPYGFVDTSDMWFEPRRRRIAVSAAGPASDFTLAGAFSLCCLAMPAGTVRQIVFQLAFAAYLGGIFNLSPLLERDGYFILVDALREPGLRTRAREHLRSRLSGRGNPARSKALARYAYFSLAWSFATATFVAILTLRYRAVFAALLPRPLVDLLIGLLWVLIFLPALALVLPPLLDRFRRRNA